MLAVWVDSFSRKQECPRIQLSSFYLKAHIISVPEKNLCEFYLNEYPVVTYSYIW